MEIKVSPGNTKTGRIPAISLPPITSCRHDAPCKKDCYALKSFRMYPNVRNAWNSNLDYYKDNQFDYFDQIIIWIKAKRKTVNFFRWHVSGDIVDSNYLEGMLDVARKCPDTRFLAFTKQYDIVNDAICGNKKYWPENLTIVFSAWPGFNMDNPFGFPIAYMQDGNETRLTGKELECPGNCETCGMCWQLPETGKNVVFNKH